MRTFSDSTQSQQSKTPAGFEIQGKLLSTIAIFPYGQYPPLIINNDNKFPKIKLAVANTKPFTASGVPYKMGRKIMGAAGATEIVHGKMAPALRIKSAVAHTKPLPARCVPWTDRQTMGRAGATEIVHGEMVPALWLNRLFICMLFSGVE